VLGRGLDGLDHEGEMAGAAELSQTRLTRSGSVGFAEAARPNQGGSSHLGGAGRHEHDIPSG
jgi:hypothetical protein